MAEKKKSSRTEVETHAYEPGTPDSETEGRWRQKLQSREERLKYLKTGERYWYSQDWFGSEKRKTQA